MRAPYPEQKPIDFDKNVLNSASSSARKKFLKNTRATIAPEAPLTDYNLRVNAEHGDKVLQTYPLIITMIVCTGLMLGLFIGPFQAIIWLTLTPLLYVLLAYTARKAKKERLSQIQALKRMRLIIAIQAMASCAWALLPLLYWNYAHESLYIASELAILMTIIALTAKACISVPKAFIITIAGPLAIFIGVSFYTVDPLRFLCSFILVAISSALYLVCKLIHQGRIGEITAKAERENLMIELELAQAQSEKARLAAEDASFAKSRFLALISHELRTPLNAIMGFSEVMSLEQLGPMENAFYKEYAGDIYKSGEHLLTIINEILDISRIEADRYELNEGPVKLTDIANDCLRMLDIKINSKQITLENEYAADLPAIWADEKSVRQVVLNILSNAIKFTPEGKGLIQLHIGWTRGGGQYISVKDNGPGIAEEEIPIVLSPFGQGSIAIRSAEQGTGLGLPIVQGIMRRHGGAFQLKSRLRAGTEAIASFPAARVTEAMGPVEVDMAS